MRGWQLLVFLVAFLIALVALLPLAVVLNALDAGSSGLAARSVGGTVWRGHLLDAQWRGNPVGDVRVGLAPLPLLLGRFELSVGSAQLQGRLRMGGSPRLQVDRARVDLDRAIGDAAAEWMLYEVDLRFDADRCRSARGQVRVDVTLAGSPRQALTGAFSCEGEEAVVQLLPEAGAVPVQAILRLRADGSFSAQWLANPDDPLLQAVLLAHGFEAGPTGLARVIAGRWLP